MTTFYPAEVPHRVFDFAFGTSGGGLSVPDARIKLQEVSNAVFGSWTSGWFTGGYISKKAPRYSSDVFKEKILTINGADERMKGGNSCCQCYVVCREVDRDGHPLYCKTPACLKTFGEGPDCRVWEAGLATSAAPTFFQQVKIESGTPTKTRYFVDGGVGFNNPILTFAKQPRQFPNTQKECYVSIGTGIPSYRQENRDRNYWRWFSKRPHFITAVTLLEDAATDTENDHDSFRLIIGENTNKKYVRFNCEDVGNFALNDYRNLEEIRRLTQRRGGNSTKYDRIGRRARVVSVYFLGLG
ncbi:acyl transferase/acyl hydrolase/lysophospholipase [Fusarium oxysporum f. sp. albedinis]|nr:acyl transferase/acyl hydrolase/lysophospholipase [Fusarium oxysporum f. sp. albedinis]